MHSSWHVLSGLFTASCLAASCWRNTECTFPTEPSFPGPWEASVYPPKTRNPRPKQILSFPALERISDFPGEATLRGNGSGVVFDFGVEVGGVTSIKYTLTGDAAYLGLAWTEAKDYIGYSSDSSNGNYRGPKGTLISQDGTWTVAVAPGPGTYEVPAERLRGGFRYLTVYLLTNGMSTLAVEDVSLEISFQPTWSNLRAYQGYFHADDDLLNRIWYAGAYTLQTNALAPETGRVTTSTITRGGWLNNATAGVGASVIVDGAKRDRWIWPGDMGVAVPSAFYGTGDLESTRNSLQTLYHLQAASGSLPGTGPPATGHGSDTYHMWAMIGTYNYVLFSGDMDFLNRNWAGYLRAMDYIHSLVDRNGILTCRGRGDWGRRVYALNGSAPNMLLYRAISTGALLAEYAPSNSNATNTTTTNTTNTTDSTSLTVTWLARAELLRNAILARFWDADQGLFFDSHVNTTLYPQDANSMALAFGVVRAGTPDAAAVSDGLTRSWTAVGPSSPELPGNVSPFISGLELEAHLAASRADRVGYLLRACWGWYANHANGTGSTAIEGYRADVALDARGGAAGGAQWGYRREAGYTDDPAYVSHAHGWSAGPVAALSAGVVGLRVTRPAGAEWALSPAFGVTARAEAGFTTTRGRFRAGYVVRDGGHVADIEWETPPGTRGWLDLGLSVQKWVEGGKGNATVEIRSAAG